MWPAIVPRLLELIRAHRSTIVFVNSRSLCERLCQRINELAGEELVRAHHGSLAHAERTEIEEQLKRGAIAGIVATSSLELGIDMGAVDLVLQVESPGSVARGLQRVGRAGHGVGAAQQGAAVSQVPRRPARGRGGRAPHARGRDRGAARAGQPARRAGAADRRDGRGRRLAGRRAGGAGAAQRQLPRRCRTSALLRVLDMLVGPLSVAPVRRPAPAPRLGSRARPAARRGAARRWSRSSTAARSPTAARTPCTSAKTARASASSTRRWCTSRMPGEMFMLGASSWRHRAHHARPRDRIAGAGRGRQDAVLARRRARAGRSSSAARSARSCASSRRCREARGARALAARIPARRVRRAATCCAYLQRPARGHRHAADRSRDHDRALPRRARRPPRVHPVAVRRARARAVGAGDRGQARGARAASTVQALWTDDGIVLRFADRRRRRPTGVARARSGAVEDLIMQQLAGFGVVREHVPRERGARAALAAPPAGRAHAAVGAAPARAELLAVAREYPAFPIVLETYRSCLKDVFDVPALIELLAAIERREVQVDVVDTHHGVAVRAHAGVRLRRRVPLRRRCAARRARAQALSLDRKLLRELLGETALRELLDPEVIADVEAELQGTRAGAPRARRRRAARSAAARRRSARRTRSRARSALDAMRAAAPDSARS